MGIDARMEKFRDPEVVTLLENQAALPEAGVFSRLTGWDNYMVGDTLEANEGLKSNARRYRSRTGPARPFTLMVEIFLNDDLKTVSVAAADRRRRRSWRSEPRR